MSTIGSIGVGLFILIIIWIVTLVIFVVAVKTQSNLGWFALAAATILTITLISIPTEKRSGEEEEDIHILGKDYSFIYRTLLILFLLFSVVVGSISFFILHCIEPIRPKPLKSFSN